MGKVPPKAVKIIDFGMVDNPSKAYETVLKIQAANLDMLFCNMLTYATSGTFGVIVRAVDVPIILVAFTAKKSAGLFKSFYVYAACER
jgi:hypothetical protein